jgi:membrane-bound serine protease (ClpP class)
LRGQEQTLANFVDDRNRLIAFGHLLPCKGRIPDMFDRLANVRFTSRRWQTGVLLLLLGVAVYSLGDTDTRESASTRLALQLTVADAIGPAIGDYIIRGIDRAVRQNASVVVIKLDTPGGLDTSMREINRAIIDSPVPVVMYVHPSGARAASAGTYMMYASHVAAMAPGTNLGAATPVQMGGGGSIFPSPDEEEQENGKDKEERESPGAGDVDAMTKKIISDAVAYIRGLAEMRGRNADWAEKAVREGVSLTASDALEMNVIDVIATNVNELLEQIHGFEVKVREQSVSLNTENIHVEVHDPDWRTEFLAVITNPNIVYLLMLLGVYGLIFELANPGSIIPGVFGAICLLIALYALQVLPVNYAGMALIILGLAFMVGELFMPSFGALGIGGLIAFIVGSIILFDTEGTGFEISLWLIGATAVTSAVIMMFGLGLAVRSFRRGVVSGAEEMLSATGKAMQDFEQEGRVFVHGEIWTAKSSQPLRAGQAVRVIGRDGLKLEVEPLETEMPESGPE